MLDGQLRDDVFFVALLDLVSAHIDDSDLPGCGDNIVVLVVRIKLGCQLGSYHAYLRQIGLGGLEFSEKLQGLLPVPGVA